MVLETSLLVRKTPELRVKRGPGGWRWRTARNFRMARTGHVEEPVAPIRMVVDLPKRLFLDCLRASWW